MAYSYLFKYIIIGDTGIVKFYMACWLVFLIMRVRYRCIICCRRLICDVSLLLFCRQPEFLYVGGGPPVYWSMTRNGINYYRSFHIFWFSDLTLGWMGRFRIRRCVKRKVEGVEVLKYFPCLFNVTMQWQSINGWLLELCVIGCFMIHTRHQFLRIHKAAHFTV